MPIELCNTLMLFNCLINVGKEGIHTGGEAEDRPGGDECTVSDSSGQFTKRIIRRFLPFHLPFVPSYFFPSLIFLPFYL